MLGTQVAAHAAQRREIIAHSPELQERGRTKFAVVADALAAELIRRGGEPATATLLADVGVAIFRTGSHLSEAGKGRRYCEQKDV